MGFGRKDDEMQASKPGAQPSSSGASRSGSGFGNLTAFIDQGSEFEGKLSFKDTVRIDGRFRGEISSDNTLIVGESGEIEANIESPTVVISGSVMGDVHATQQLVLYKTARLHGDVTTPSLVMEEGAVLNGTIKMAAASAVAKPAGSKPADAASASGTSGTSGGSGSQSPSK